MASHVCILWCLSLLCCCSLSLARLSDYVEDGCRFSATQKDECSSRDRILQSYYNILNESDVEEGLKEVFQTVRIAVFGRSGSGKTSLIRLILGEDGPQSIKQGSRATHDINREWHSSNPEIPIIIHDSDGIDTDGKNRMRQIKSFLDKHQMKTSDLSQQIQLVWYVFSAGDTRLLDDEGLIKVISSYNIPLLLIMTHNDWKEAVEQNVNDIILDKLLSGVRDKESVKYKMVRVSNRVHIDEKNRLIQDKVDTEALKLVSERTMEHIYEKRRYTWAASQAVDFDGKLSASADLIVFYKKMAVFTSITGLIPFAQQKKLSYMSLNILRSLCKIWRVPLNLENALIVNLAMSEGGSLSSLQRLLYGMSLPSLDKFGAAMEPSREIFGAAVGTIVSNTPVPFIAGLVAAYLMHMDANLTTFVLMDYSCVILGSILYVKSMQLTKDNWDADKPEHEYAILCNNFAAMEYSRDLVNHLHQSHSTWETLFNAKMQEDKIKTHIIAIFQEMLVYNRSAMKRMKHSFEKTWRSLLALIRMDLDFTI